MSTYRAPTNPHIGFNAAIVLGLAAAILLAGCDLQRQSQGNPTGGPATQVIVQPTPVLGPTSNVPAVLAVSAPASSDSVSTAAAPAGLPTIAPTSEADALGDEVDQDLQQLDDLNKSTDPLDDPP